MAYGRNRRSTGWFASLMLAILAFVIAFIPTWIYLLARCSLNPHGFWQELVLGVVALWFLGFIQFILFLLFIGALLMIFDK